VRRARRSPAGVRAGAPRGANPSGRTHAALRRAASAPRSFTTRAARTARSWTWRATGRASRSAPRRTSTGARCDARRQELLRCVRAQRLTCGCVPCSTISIFNPVGSWSAKWLRVGACCRRCWHALARALAYAVLRAQSGKCLAAMRCP
jgi:hypothetical protein